MYLHQFLKRVNINPIYLVSCADIEYYVAFFSNLWRINSTLLLFLQIISPCILWIFNCSSLLRCLSDINSPKFFGFFESLPLFRIFFCVNLELLKFWHHLANCGKKRRQDEVDEAWLTLSNLSGLTIAQERHSHTLLLLHIALVEKFFEQENSPLDGYIKRSRLRWDIGCMDHKFDQLLLSVKFFLRWLTIDK